MTEDDMRKEIARMLQECSDASQIAMIYAFIAGILKKRSGL